MINKIQAVELNDDVTIGAQAVIITAGTFMKGLLHFGLKNISEKI